MRANEHFCQKRRRGRNLLVEIWYEPQPSETRKNSCVYLWQWLRLWMFLFFKAFCHIWLRNHSYVTVTCTVTQFLASWAKHSCWVNQQLVMRLAPQPGVQLFRPRVSLWEHGSARGWMTGPICQRMGRASSATALPRWWRGLQTKVARGGEPQSMTLLPVCHRIKP